jgi:hypothetical protein
LSFTVVVLATLAGRTLGGPFLRCEPNREGAVSSIPSMAEGRNVINSVVENRPSERRHPGVSELFEQVYRNTHDSLP